VGILDLFSLKGRNALVTGSGQGLGAGMAIAFAQAGANVTLHNYDKVLDETIAEVEKTGVQYICRSGDVCDRSIVHMLVDDPVAAFGAIDTNLNAVWYLSQYAGRKMLEQGRGKIINTASLLAFQGGILVPGYAAAKGAVAQLTKALANEWADKGINVNAIAPGYMATDNTAPLRADPARSQAILSRIPMGRWGLPSDLAGAAVLLASQAGSYIQGHVLVVDGGWLCR
jgi:2-deoxy-D-gluconate 3-dehydrogenase